MRLLSVLSLSLIGLAPVAFAQRPVPAEASQFAFLVGQWDVTAKPPAHSLAEKIHGVRALTGTWTAWRAMDGFGVDDELRIVDPSGNPHLVAHSLRMYDPAAKAWKSTTFDAFGGAVIPMSGAWNGHELTITSSALGAGGKTLVRARFHDITPGSFAFTEDRSTDGGATWSELFTADAKRVAASASR